MEPDTETESMRVAIRLPVPKDLPEGMEFAKTLTVMIPQAANIPKIGDTFSFTAELKKAKADSLFPPLFVLYGVGPNAGKLQFGINLAEAKAVEGR